MYNLAFLHVLCVLVDMRWNHVFNYLSSCVLCMIGMCEAIGDDSGGLVRLSGGGEHSKRSS